MIRIDRVVALCVKPDKAEPLRISVLDSQICMNGMVRFTLKRRLNPSSQDLSFATAKSCVRCGPPGRLVPWFGIPITNACKNKLMYVKRV